MSLYLDEIGSKRLRALALVLFEMAIFQADKDRHHGASVVSRETFAPPADRCGFLRTGLALTDFRKDPIQSFLQFPKHLIHLRRR